MHLNDAASKDDGGAGSVRSLEDEIARISGEELVAAFGLGRAPIWVQRLAQVGIEGTARPLARVFARFDRRIGEVGIDVAAREALVALGVRWTADAAAPPEGPLLVVSNHPGACDAFTLLAALGRRDLAVFAAERSFLRTLPTVARHHLVLVPTVAEGRAAPHGAIAPLRHAARHLARGGALLHFPAGGIEPDPVFLGPGDAPLKPWQAGTGAFVRAVASAGGRVVVAAVGGVHSRRIKRSVVVRAAERRGVMTLALLLQAALPDLGDTDAHVRFGAAQEAAELTRDSEENVVLTARLKDQATALLGARPWPA